MSTNNPPTFYFPNIDFNDAFYIPTSTGISLSYANANYLSRQGTATSIATSTTFNNSVTIGNTTITQSGNNLILTNGSNIALTLTNALNTSFLSGYSTQSYLNSISSGIMYLAGLSGTTSGAYDLQTDSLGHLSFATGTNTLNIGTSGAANGNINLYGQGVLTIPATTGNAISVPNGNINSNTISTTATATIGTSLQVNSFANIGGNILMNGATSSVLYTNNATNQLRIQGAPATSTYGVIISTNAGGSGDALSVIPTGVTTALITLAQPTNITSTLNVGNQMTLNSTVSANRQILSSYFNMGGTLAGAPAYCGRVYGDIGLMVFECPQAVGISSFIFYAQNNAVPINAFQISATAITTPNPISCSTLTTTANINLNGANSSITNNNAGGSITIGTPNLGSNIYLNANNIAGLTITSTSIQSSLPLTFAVGSNPTTLSQLGGVSIIQATTLTLQTSTGSPFRQLAVTPTLAIGTYMLNGFMQISNATNNLINGYVLCFNSITASQNLTLGSPYFSAVSTGYNGGLGYGVTATTGVLNMSCSLIINLTVATPIYLNYNYNTIATFSTIGQINITRIG